MKMIMSILPKPGTYPFYSSHIARQTICINNRTSLTGINFNINYYLNRQNLYKDLVIDNMKY